MKVAKTLAAALLVGLTSQSVQSQSYPAKPVRLVVPVAPGGNLDIVSRAMAERLSAQMGKPMLVENRAGANSIIGTVFVAKSPADGYTYLMMASTFIITPSIMPKMPYDPVKDFAGVSLIAWIPQILVVHPSVPAKTVKELIAYGKANPGKLNFASSGGSGSHIASELFGRQAGIELVPVLYKGSALALTDVVGGHVAMMIDTLSTSSVHVKDGKLRALGVTSPARSVLFPDIPTINETIPGYEARIFNAMMAPAGTQKTILDRMHSEIQRAVQVPGMQSRFSQQGVELTASTSPEQFNEFIQLDYQRWAKVIKEAKIKAE